MRCGDLMNARRIARKEISACRRMDKWLEGKTPKEQLNRVSRLLELYKSETDVPIDRYIEAVNRKISLERNGISKKKPMAEGPVDSQGLVAARCLSGTGGC